MDPDARRLTPDAAMEWQVDRFAHGIAETCTNLSDDDLRSCFSEYFNASADCALFERCREIYRKQTSLGVEFAKQIGA